MKSTSIRRPHSEGPKCRFAAVASFLLLLVLSDHAVADTFGSGDNSFDLDFVMIGDPANAPEMAGNTTSEVTTGGEITPCK